MLGRSYSIKNNANPTKRTQPKGNDALFVAHGKGQGQRQGGVRLQAWEMANRSHSSTVFHELPTTPQSIT
jgi:hypothetical protein